MVCRAPPNTPEPQLTKALCLPVRISSDSKKLDAATNRLSMPFSSRSGTCVRVCICACVCVCVCV